jgi:flagellar hook-associated protein 2
METDSIIKELMKAQSLKKTKVENKITKGEWKQEKWKELNTKIYALYTGSISKMKLQGSYNSKKVSSSDETKVSVTASANAVSGSHKIQVNQLASAQYISGSKLADINNGDGTTTAVNGSTKLVAIDPTLGATESSETKINFSTKEKDFSLTVTENTTVNDFINAAKQAGITATYDTSQKRFFLSSSNSGNENAYSITTSTVEEEEIVAKNEVRDLVGYSDLDGASQATVDNAIDQYKTISNLLDNASLSAETKEKYQKQLVATQDTINKFVQLKVTTDLKKAYTNNEVDDSLTTQYGVRTYSEVVAEATQIYNDKLGDKEYSDEDLAKAKDKAIALEASKYAAAVKSDFIETVSATNPYTIATLESDDALDTVDSTAFAGEDVVAGGTNKLNQLGLATVAATIDDVTGQVSYSTSDASLTLTKASDSEVVYNGAVLTGTSNTITANGLTFDVHAVTKDLAVPTITLTVSKDTQGTYDAIKKFVKDYNEVLKEMNTLYNADSSRGYDPLTDEEKDTMSEDQIEKWESKIKNSLLRRDDKLSSLLGSMKNSVMTSVGYEGKSYSLASFGINTAVYTERGLLHIDGDSEDSVTSGKKDKLMKALEENPEAVMNTLSTLTGSLYSEMTDKMKATTLSSALTFYNDKEITKNIKTYKTDLSRLEDRLKTMEDRYYDQFGAMETAMAKLNSQTSSLASLMGTGK